MLLQTHSKPSDFKVSRFLVAVPSTGTSDMRSILASIVIMEFSLKKLQYLGNGRTFSLN